MKKLVADYARYNLWANERIISVVKEMDTSLIDKDLGSSFPSIRQTLLHIWDVETLWLQRLKGENPTAFPSKSFTGSHEEIYASPRTISDDDAAMRRDAIPPIGFYFLPPREK
jgi:uncharacterized damage-inducible protein DinB